MVRGKAYRQTKDKPNRSIYFQSKKFTKRDFLHDGKQIYLQYKMYCMDQQTQQERSRRSGGFFLFAVIFQRVRHLCREKTTHFLFLKEYLARVEIIGTYVLDKLPNEFFKTFN